MAPAENDYSDEYVAKAMKQEAQASSKQYSAVGLEAFRPKRSDTSYLRLKSH